MNTTVDRVTAEAQAAEEAARSHLAALAEAANQPPAGGPPQPEEPAAAPPPAPQPTATPVDVERRLRELEQQISTDRGRLIQQNETIARLQAELARKPEAPPAPAAPPTPKVTITPDEEKEFGADLIEFITKVVTVKFGSVLQDLPAKVAQIEGKIGNIAKQTERVQSVATETAMDRYTQRLDQTVPGWEQVNEDPAFIAWLENVDKLTKKKYMELLQSAHQGLDAERVAHIFKLYKPDLGAAPAPAAAPTNPPTNSGYIDPASLAAPPTMPSAPAPSAPPPGKVWTQAEVDKMFDDHSKGRITPQQFASLEADYIKALKEGRVHAQ